MRWLWLGVELVIGTAWLAFCGVVGVYLGARYLVPFVQFLLSEMQP